jgi:hypothetical protein
MSTSLIVIEGGDLLAFLGPDFAAAFALATAEKAPATRKALRLRLPPVQGVLRRQGR